MGLCTVDWLRRVRANGGNYQTDNLEAAIRSCERRASDAELLLNWPLLAESWRRDAETLRALLPKDETP